MAVCGKIRFKLAVYGQKKFHAVLGNHNFCSWFSVFACLLVIIQALALLSYFFVKEIPLSPRILYACMRLYVTPIRLGLLSTLTANQITDSKCVSSEQILWRPFLVRYKILPQILNTMLLQRINLAFVGLLLSKKL